MSFVDQCKIFFKAGDGGDGIVAWRREAHVPLGGPAGGDGGNGGSIIIVGDHNEHSLQNLKYLKKIIAKNGGKGEIKNMHGKNASDVYVKVPLGTQIIDLKTNKIIADIIYNNQEFVICYGGQGGHGNFYFKSGLNKAPSLFELGDKGEQKECLLILKQIADVGIIGLPNAGKSTFISKITNAKPNIADYQFTTLNPILGIYKNNNKQYIFADIPGLISGASDGIGLGHDFLKHIERTKVLIHIISMNPYDNEDPYLAYNTIISELEKYSPSLLEKPMIIVANKIDCDGAKDNYLKFISHFNNNEIIKISAKENQNLDLVVQNAIYFVDKENSIPSQENDKPKIIGAINENNKENQLSKELIINKINEYTWDVKCEYLEYWSNKIPLTTSDNVIRFNQKMQSANVEETLKKLGAKNKDTIKIYNVEMEYED